MSGSANTTSKAATVEVAPESPTTARPLEMDDDDVQESGLLPAEEPTAKPTATATSPPAASPPASEDAPPPKPPRPVSQAQEHEQMLQEAFPTVEIAVIKAVLSASAGHVERAFNALLQMTDPDAAQADTPPPPPPRPAVEPIGPTSTNLSQLEADELYARQLAEHYENVGAYEARTANRAAQRGPSPGMPRGRQQTGLTPNPNQYDQDREHSFIDDELPVIKETLRKGFVETQSKVNTWFTNLKKKIDEQFDEEEHTEQAGNSSFMGRPSRDPTRRSNDYDRYDNDPELLSDDFAGMKFNSDGTPVQNNRSFSNPNLFKPPPPPSKSPKPGDNRRVAFNETVEDIDAYNASPKLPPKDSPVGGGAGGGKASKWQPLSAVEPSPVAENDPFSLGDSEDERDVKDKKETKSDDADRLRKATADAMADSLVDDKPKAATGGDSASK